MVKRNFVILIIIELMIAITSIMLAVFLNVQWYIILPIAFLVVVIADLTVTLITRKQLKMPN